MRPRTKLSTHSTPHYCTRTKLSMFPKLKCCHVCYSSQHVHPKLPKLHPSKHKRRQGKQGVQKQIKQIKAKAKANKAK